jgi:hypothetical protein
MTKRRERKEVIVSDNVLDIIFEHVEGLKLFLPPEAVTYLSTNMTNEEPTRLNSDVALQAL